MAVIEEIKKYGVAKSIKPFINDIDFLLKQNKVDGLHGSMWESAYELPHRLAGLYDQRFLVIIDEFQNLSNYVYPDQNFQTSPIDTLPGSFHSVVESKIAPMLVTGSYVSWLIEISGKYLEAGRLKEWSSRRSR